MSGCEQGARLESQRIGIVERAYDNENGNITTIRLNGPAARLAIVGQVISVQDFYGHEIRLKIEKISTDKVFAFCSGGKHIPTEQPAFSSE